MIIPMIPIDKAIQRAVMLSRELGLPQDQEIVFKQLMASHVVLEIKGSQFVKRNTFVSFLKNFEDAINQKNFSWLLQKRGLKVDRIVEVEEFVKSSEFMNQARDVRPLVMKTLNDFWHGDYVEALHTGSIGWGKSYAAEMSMAYMLYLLSCYHNPQLEFDLGLGSSIVFIQQSKTETLAKRVLFDQFSQRLKESKYFKNFFFPDPYIKSELRFPKNISVIPVGGNETAGLGMNVFGGIIDELNFMEVVIGGVHSRFSGEDEYDQAERAYTALLRRIKSRFIQKEGRIPGRLILISSRNYKDDFTERKMKEVAEEIKETGKTMTYVTNYKQWDSIPEERYCGKKFLIEVGDDSKMSRIVENVEQSRDPERIIEVPVEYKSDFKRDMDGALKDIAGIVVGTSAPFIPFRELIALAQTKYLSIHNDRSLFKKKEIFLSVIDPVEQIWEEIVNMDYIEEDIIDPSQTFACHIDVGLDKERGDAAGLAIGRIFGYTVLPSYKYFNERREEFIEVKDIRAPIYHIDGVIQIRARMGDEIDLNLIRDLILWLRGHLNIKYCTMDTYQSVMMLQAFRRAKIKSGPLSVDTSIAPYTELKLSIKDQRIYFPQHEVLAKEIREVEKDPKKNKVDHPKRGSKDISDAVAGVIYILQHKEANYSSGRRSRRNSEEKEKEVERPRSRVIRVRRL